MILLNHVLMYIHPHGHTCVLQGERTPSDEKLQYFDDYIVLCETKEKAHAQDICMFLAYILHMNVQYTYMKCMKPNNKSVKE